MLYLNELITKDTPILNLINDAVISKEKKKEILGNDGSLSKEEEYLKMMYLMNNICYYYKEELENYGHPFYLMDELMGSFLARKLDLNTVNYFITITKKRKIGLSSQNFKKSGFDYYFGNYYSKNYQLSLKKDFDVSDITNIDNLKILCSSDKNAERFIKQILTMLALDIFMLQKDRKEPNIQFQISQNQKYIELGPLYDFSNCNSQIDEKSGLMLKNCILTINEHNINLLIRKYKDFSVSLSYLLKLGICNIWQEICIHYNFNQNCQAYEEVYNYYKIKEESQRRYLKLYLDKN